MLVFYDPVPASTNPDRHAILYTVEGDVAALTAGKTNWIEVPTQEIEALDAWRVENGALILADLTPYRREAVARVNTRAGVKRLEFITDIPGQQMLYTAKEQEAVGYLAEIPEPADLSAYPLMAAEVGPGLTAATPLELAQLWAAMAAQWRMAAAMIENARLSTVYAIESAADLPSIDAAVALFTAAMSQIQPQP